MFTPEVYRQRRQALMQSLADGRILCIGNRELGRNYRDNTFPFRQDSTMLYFTGLNIPNIHLILDCDTGQSILIGDDQGIDHSIWTGAIPGMRELADLAGIEQVRPTRDLQNLVDKGTHFLPPYHGDHQLLLHQLTGVRPHLQEKRASESLIGAVIALRSIKTAEEIKRLHNVSALSQDMHEHLMNITRAGIYEYELVAEAHAFAVRHNHCFSYSPILSKRGEVLHNHHHHLKLGKGDLLLFDGGCEDTMGYAGDITRTWPVSGVYTNKQREIYDVVYAAYNHAVSKLIPGVKYMDVHRGAARVIYEGLKAIGLVRGDVDEAVEQGVHTLFFPHGLGHMIGLDVHDMENLGENLIGYDKNTSRRKEFGWRSLRLGKGLQAGYTITVEPGIYFIPALIDLRRSEGKFLDFVNYKKLEGYKNFGGVRIEDDFLITANGAKILGKKIATSADEIESRMAG